MPREIVLTPQGLDELKAKIEHLQNDRRREVADRIKEAREFGDISENAEYDDAKNEQAMLEKQISDLEEKLRSATVIDSKDGRPTSVTVGTTVHLKDQKTAKSRSSTSSARPRPTPPSRSSRTSRRSARRCSARSAARSSRSRSRAARAQAEDHQDRSR